jgi:hypothetical protein
LSSLPALRSEAIIEPPQLRIDESGQPDSGKV